MAAAAAGMAVVDGMVAVVMFLWLLVSLWGQLPPLLVLGWL